MAPFVLPINGFAQASLASSAKLDATVLPLSALEQRTFFSALQQWNQQGATEVPASVQVPIDPTHYTNPVLQANGTTPPAVIPAGALDGNTSAALQWPGDLQSVDFPFTVAKAGLYELSMTYYNYASCFAPGLTTMAEINSGGSVGNVGGQLCGRSNSAERGFMIDPPGTVPTVPISKTSTPTNSQAVTAAEAAGIAPNQLPGWINPLNDLTLTTPSPAWTIANPKDPKAQACALDLAGTNGQPAGYDGYEYQEARQVPFNNVWKETGATPNPKTGYVNYIKDNQGDDLQPLPVQVPQWRTVDARDAEGIYRNPLLFCLSAGQHVLRVQMVREPMAIQSIVFHGVAPLPTYQQALAQWQSEGMKPVNCGMCLEVQGENIYRMSDAWIQPGSDPYPTIVPQTHGYQIFNMLNGQFFNLPNEWVEYKINVSQTGLYELSFKELQAGLQGLPAGRSLFIDGQLPFDGAQWISVPFRNSWNVVTLTQPDGKPALIGLTKGTHIIKLRITLGLVGQTITVINQSTQRLSELLREIMMITGPTPSPVVQYNLPQNVPDLIPQMKAIISVLRQQAQILTYAGGDIPPVAANSIDITAADLEHMTQYPDSIQMQLMKWQQDEQALASWSEQLQIQPMSLDWFALTTPGYRLPSPLATVWQQMAVTWQTFILSFYRDYSGVGSRFQNALTVWTGAGQLWAAIMSQMANAEFTPTTGIHVNFNVVPGAYNVVLLAEVSGHGPDVATGMPATAPVDFALRGGAYDLSKLPDWQNVVSRFVPSATLPFQYTNPQGQTGVYGVPETQGLTILMYRKDILAALHLPVPSTWPEVYQELPKIEQYGMEFYYGGGDLPFLYQYGGAYYQKDPKTGAIVSALSSPQANTAYQAWTSLYTKWRVPLQANFFTRFQTGEMPLGVAAYGDFVTMTAAAPEMAGLWSISRIPGVPYICQGQGNSDCQVVTPDSTGTAIVTFNGLSVNAGSCAYPDFPNEPAVPAGFHCFTNFTTGGDSSAVIIPTHARHPNQAWEFVKWWTSAPVQLQFGNDIEAVGGVTTAWSTANLQAMAGLPWPEKDLQVFQKVWSQYEPVPVVPGGYISARYINDVWTNVVINGENLRGQLQWAVQNINDELYRQEVLYGLVKAQKGRIAVGA